MTDINHRNTQAIRALALAIQRIAKDVDRPIDAATVGEIQCALDYLGLEALSCSENSVTAARRAKAQLQA